MTVFLWGLIFVYLQDPVLLNPKPLQITYIHQYSHYSDSYKGLLEALDDANVFFKAHYLHLFNEFLYLVEQDCTVYIRQNPYSCFKCKVKSYCGPFEIPKIYLRPCPNQTFQGRGTQDQIVIFVEVNPYMTIDYDSRPCKHHSDTHNVQMGYIRMRDISAFDKIKRLREIIIRETFVVTVTNLLNVHFFSLEVTKNKHSSDLHYNYSLLKEIPDILEKHTRTFTTYDGSFKVTNFYITYPLYRNFLRKYLNCYEMPGLAFYDERYFDRLMFSGELMASVFGLKEFEVSVVMGAYVNATHWFIEKYYPRKNLHSKGSGCELAMTGCYAVELKNPSGVAPNICSKSESCYKQNYNKLICRSHAAYPDYHKYYRFGNIIGPKEAYSCPVYELCSDDKKDAEYSYFSILLYCLLGLAIVAFLTIVGFIFVIIYENRKK